MKYTLENLLDFSNAADPKIDVEKLYPLLDDENDEIRLFVAELLSYDGSDKTKGCLLQLLQNDANELVRSEAADSLSFFEDKSLLPLLFEAFQAESSDTVKSYILFAVIDIVKHFDGQLIQQEITGIFNSETCIKLKTICAAYLYRCGKTDLFAFILKTLDSEDRYVRLCAIEQLIEICTKENVKEMQAHLKHHQMENDPFVSVREKVYGILAYPV